MPLNLDIDQLRAFSTVAQTRSFTKTGSMLNRSQSTISLQIKRLETALNRQLFDRSGRKIRLTDEGARFLPEAERIVDMHDRAVELLSSPSVSGRVRLGCTEEFAATHLANVLGSFQYTHPDVHIEIGVDTSKSLRDGFSERDYDVVLAKVEENERNGDTIWCEDIIWVVTDGPSANDILRRDPIPLLASPVPCLIRYAMTTKLDQIGKRWQIVGTSEVNVGLQAAVSAGFGITALPRSAIRPSMRPIAPEWGLPPLPRSEVRLFENLEDGNDAARCMSDHIRKRVLPSGVYI
ncbi:LysR family transcriptional regulator [Rhodospirillales bacterium]|nr:LysR family transcriptional regulator [Rhodospirillales bacterium]